MDEGLSYNEQDIARAREQFPKADDSLSHAHIAPGPEGTEVSGIRVTGHFGGKDEVIRVLPEKFRGVESEADKRLLEQTFSKLGDRIPPERQQILIDLVASFGRPGTSCLGEVQRFLNNKAANIARAEDPEVQANSEINGFLGEKINLMFGLDDPQARIVFGQENLRGEVFRQTRLVETSRLLESKAFLAKLLLTIEQDVPREVTGRRQESQGMITTEVEVGPAQRVFREAVRRAGYPKESLNRAVIFDAAQGGYVANPEVLLEDARPVVRILNIINEALDRPDALIVPLIGEGRGEERIQVPSEFPIGVVENKAYYPWEVRRMAELTANNPNGSEIGGVDDEGHRLVIGLARQLNYVEQLAPAGFNRRMAVRVLSFPADAPVEALEEIGQLATQRGNQNLVIRILPYTRVELDTLTEVILSKAKVKGIISPKEEKKA